MDPAHEARAVDRRRSRRSSRRWSSTTTSRRTEIIIFCVIVPSIILHEVSHGWVANAFGDDTAKRAGRLTLNPVVHVDPVGTLIVPALLSLGGVGVLRLGQAGARQRRPAAQPAQSGCAGLVGRSRHQRVPGRHLRPDLRPRRPAGSLRRSGRPLSVPRSSSTPAWSTWASASFNLIPVPPLDGSVALRAPAPVALTGRRTSIPPVHHADHPRAGHVELLLVPARPAHLALRPPLQLVGRRARVLGHWVLVTPVLGHSGGKSPIASAARA